MDISTTMQSIRYLMNKYYPVFANQKLSQGMTKKEYVFRQPITAKEALDIYTDHLAGLSYKQIRERHKLSQPTVYRIIRQNEGNLYPNIDNISYKKPKKIK